MITRLTPEQEALLPVYRDRWRALGLQTGPADRPRAAAAVHWMYAQARLPAPRIVWCGSPLATALTRALLLQAQPRAAPSVWPDVWNSVREGVWHSVRESVREGVRASVRDSLRDRVSQGVWAHVGTGVRDSVRDSVVASVGASVGVSVRHDVRDRVGEGVWASVEAGVWASVGVDVGEGMEASVLGAGVGVVESVRASVYESIYGQHDASWLGFYAFFAEVCGLQAPTAPLYGLWELAHAAHWCLPCQGLVWCAERPSSVHQDEQWRLHCADGPALLYPDGWALWYWHGQAVSEQLILRPDTITLEQITAARNVETQRLLIERFGWDRYMDAVGATLLAADTEPVGVPGLRGLFAVQEQAVRLLVCTCASTGRTYALPVPQEVETCQQAANWLAQHDTRFLLART